MLPNNLIYDSTNVDALTNTFGLNFLLGFIILFIYIQFFQIIIVLLIFLLINQFSINQLLLQCVNIMISFFLLKKKKILETQVTHPLRLTNKEITLLFKKIYLNIYPVV